MADVMPVANPLVPTVGEGIGVVVALAALLLVVALILGFLIWSPRRSARRMRRTGRSGDDTTTHLTNTS